MDTKKSCLCGWLVGSLLLLLFFTIFSSFFISFLSFLKTLSPSVLKSAVMSPSRHCRFGCAGSTPTVMGFLNRQ
jgi:hypothetical protein